MKHFLKKLWHFIWHENSMLSWAINIILAFIIVKFLVYPGLGFILSTSHPLVAVVSGSMEHDNLNFDEWWEKHKDFYIEYGITKEQFRNFPFKNGFNKGDIMVLLGIKNNLNIGDVIVYNGNYKEPIIHRVIKQVGNEKVYLTKGDRNPTIDPVQPQADLNIVGKAVFRIPLLGWIKIIFTKIIGGF